MNKKIILYLSDLIKDNNRVIVPDFGAFIVKNGSKKLLIFNEFLKYNDGLLAEVLAHKEKISKEEALKQITEFVVAIKAELDAKKEVVLEGIGTIKVNELGKLAFIQQLENEPAAPPKQPEPPKVEKEKKADIIEIDEPKKVEKPKAAAPPPPPKETPKPQETKPKAPEPVKKDPVKEPVKEVKAEPKKEVAPKPVAKPEAKPVAKPTPPPVRKSYMEEKEGPFKRFGQSLVALANNRVVLHTLIIIIILVLIGGAVFIINDTLKTGKPEKIVLEPVSQSDEDITLSNTADITNDNDDAITSDSKAQEDAVTNEIISDLKKNNATTKPVVSSPVSTNDKYFVIAGCFSVEKNADKLAAKLQNQGYKASKFGKIGNLHAVCYQSFQSKSEATNYLREIRRETKSNAWLYVKK